MVIIVHVAEDRSAKMASTTLVYYGADERHGAQPTTRHGVLYANNEKTARRGASAHEGQVLVPRPGELGELEAVRGTRGTRSSTGNSKADGEFKAAGSYIIYDY
jgi:hypothetical protein